MDMEDPVAGQSLRLEYFFDPLCGWCYASAPALAAIAEACPDALRMRPSGLFSGGGACRMASIADHAWRNDTRIADLTGQEFSADYRDRVLRDPDALFDSAVATGAIVAVGEIDPALEPRLLHALQRARYVGGEDTALAPVVASVAAALCGRAGHVVDEAAFATRLRDDEALAARTAARVGETLERMRGLPGSGVPQLLVSVGCHREVVQGTALYGGGAAVEAAILAAVARAGGRG